MEIKSLLQSQRTYFATGATLNLDFRIAQLKKLKSLITRHESEINHALAMDLHKNPLESFVTEITLVIEEINFIIKNLKTWAENKKTYTPFPICWPGQSKIHYEPYGCVLIIGTWNYPILLLFSPLVGAICAGNCVIVKPSEIASHTEALLIKLFSEYFPPQYIAAIKASGGEMNTVLQEKFDYLFFTGSTSVGKIIMTSACQHLTPFTLELGGKSPCIVDKNANIDFAARRICWGKMTNAGQTCIAPDYVYVHASRKEELIAKLQKALHQFVKKDEDHKSYCRIINEKHFKRLTNLLKNGRILFGGDINEAERYIALTLIDQVTWDDPIMQDEIFGPLLPIFTFENIEEVITLINSKPKPLALYLFTNDKCIEKEVINRVSFGGGGVNDCLLHIANPHLPFGGVGQSGMGKYHGKFSFETFSHRKAIYKKSFLFDYSLEYPPYGRTKSWLVRQILRWSSRLLLNFK